MNRGNIILLILCAIGIIIGTILLVEGSAFQKSAKITQGTVTNSSSTYFYVTYTSDDGSERTHKGSQSKNRKHRDGETMKVFYQTDNPDKSRITDTVKGGKTVLIVMGLLLLLDMYLIYTNRKRGRVSDNFRTTGRKVGAEIIKIDTDMTTTILEKHPYFIECRWVDPQTGREYSHTIRNIWTDPKPLLAGRNSIDVYIDRTDPENYFMDIEFLGELAR
jgi:hypothetical protein